MIDISPERIKYAESILLRDGRQFDELERLPFIKRFDTIDLQAVPGSGKTTALLAKILIIEMSLPLADGSGILMLSHTNGAVEKIQREIKQFCPKAFNYPSHIGTIQSFVDKFLAIPYYRNCFNRSPIICDDSYYERTVKKLFCIRTSQIKHSRNQLYKKLWSLWKGKNPFIKMRFKPHENNVILADSIQGDKIVFCKPRPDSRSYVDYSQGEKDEIYSWGFDLKRELLESEGILHYDDAYFLANRYLAKTPQLPTLLRERFKYIFVDEMQDMQAHQTDLLEQIFCTEDKTRCFQRIGDINQTIYNSHDFEIESTWNLNGREHISLSGSHRLCTVSSQIVEKFGLKHLQIKSLKDDAIERPKLILFKKDNVEQVLPFFASIVQAHKNKYPDFYDGKYPVKAIGWRKDADKGISIKNYFPAFSDLENSTIKGHTCLWNDIIRSRAAYCANAYALRHIKNALLTALCRVLRDENYPNIALVSTPNRLMSFLTTEQPSLYCQMNELIYRWIGLIAENEIEHAYKEANFFIIESLLPTLGLRYKYSQEYCEIRFEVPDKKQQRLNFYTHPDSGIEVEVSTVHQSKGETHLATLYLETYFQNDGRAGVSYESQRLIEQLTGVQIDSDKIKKRAKQSAKMVYVGFSRPKYLLCYAANVEHFNEESLAKMSEFGWDIKKELG